MARVFISHSSRDAQAADRIKSWLGKQGFETPFLDFDKHAGIPVGANWEQTLYREIERCEAVLIIHTANWMDSKWCFAEFTQVRALGKPIFPVIETPTGETFIARAYPKTATGPTELVVGAAPTSASIGQPGEEDQFRFTVTTAGRHVLQTGGQSDLVMKLYGPNSSTALIAEDDDSGEGLNPRISKRLVPGDYLVQVRHYNRQNGTGAYTIGVTR